MWCRNCQQDVPAVARGARNPLVCPRCEEDLPVLSVTADPAVGGGVSDVGVALDSSQQPSLGRPPFEMLAQEQHQLSRIARKLGPVRRENQLQQCVAGSERSGSENSGTESISSADQPSLRIDWAHTIPPLAIATCEESVEAPAGERRDARVAAIGYQARSQPPHATTSWLLSMLLFGGIFSLTCGIGLLVHATMTGHGANLSGGLIWQAGLTITLIGEGTLIVGLTWMAIRLWRNGRRVNHQLQGVDRQLAELQYQSDVSRSMRTSSSTAFYDHFAQGVSSPMLLSNLRGGLDQLAKRMK